MFGWFRPRCPCDPAAKRWVEERLHWLAKQFGLPILLERPIILPTQIEVSQSLKDGRIDPRKSREP